MRLAGHAIKYEGFKNIKVQTYRKEISRKAWADNIIIYLEYLSLPVVNWVDSSQESDSTSRRTFVNMALNLRV